MRDRQALFDTMTNFIEKIYASEKRAAGLVFVHDDTSLTFGAELLRFHRQTPVNLQSPDFVHSVSPPLVRGFDRQTVSTGKHN